MQTLRRPPTASLLAAPSRGYAISVKAPRVYESKTGERYYPEKKTFRYNQYARLLQSDRPLIFLNHHKFSLKNMTLLRSAIADAAGKYVPKPTTPEPTAAAGKDAKGKAPAAVAPAPVELPTLTVIRTAILGAALRQHAPLDTAAARAIAEAVSGGLAVLTLPELNPPQLNAVLRAIERAVPPPKPPTPAEIKAKEDAAKADPPSPGKRMKRQRTVHAPEMALLGALIEGRVFAPPGVRDVATLPTLQTLHAQLVGLLSAPATQLAGVLSEASGGKLKRTLEGLQKSLEEAAAESGSATPTA
ncbi:unnamed protein product [Peniophora sp. CBMAI 1063]|nr:unnamed protein product [Peniophora sp. CBMAI 1063]